jgi:hypothetical protein
MDFDFRHILLRPRSHDGIHINKLLSNHPITGDLQSRWYQLSLYSRSVVLDSHAHALCC